MEEIAVVSDVHSNLEALEAVLSHLGNRKVLFLGDLVGYGGSPNEVVEIFRRLGARGVRGNHDNAAVTGDVTWFNSRAAVALSWTRRALSPNNIRFLGSLPLQISEEVNGTRVYLAHGSPEDNLHEYVSPRTHLDLFPYYLKKTECDLIGLGHTHVPFVWEGEEGIVFNPGSVGQPRDGNPRASYATVNFEESLPKVEIRRVEYDVGRAAAKIVQAGLPTELADRVRLGL
jgi:putative phosphoesterase